MVPGGFGDRGIEGKITAIRYAREQKIPFFGICLGYAGGCDRICAQCCWTCRMQTAPRLIHRHHYPVIDLLPEQKDIEDLGGTMRLGLYPCKIDARIACDAMSMMMNWYTNDIVTGMSLTMNTVKRSNRQDFAFPELRRMAVWLKWSNCQDHPWFLAVQFHPEFTSRPNRPQTLFRGFVRAALQVLD